MSIPENILHQLEKRCILAAPVMPTLLEHIAWVTIWPTVPNSPSHWDVKDQPSPRYRVWRFEMSLKDYQAFRAFGDIFATEAATLKEQRHADTEADLENILLNWQVNVEYLYSQIDSGYPCP
jgi:hypothetical protein